MTNISSASLAEDQRFITTVNFFAYNYLSAVDAVHEKQSTPNLHESICQIRVGFCTARIYFNVANGRSSHNCPFVTGCVVVHIDFTYISVELNVELKAVVRPTSKLKMTLLKQPTRKQIFLSPFCIKCYPGFACSSKGKFVMSILQVDL